MNTKRCKHENRKFDVYTGTYTCLTCKRICRPTWGQEKLRFVKA